MEADKFLLKTMNKYRKPITYSTTKTKIIDFFQVVLAITIFWLVVYIGLWFKL